jgi:hypothetical protein
MRGAIHPLPQYTFVAWRSVKAQGQHYLNGSVFMGFDWFSEETAPPPTHNTKHEMQYLFSKVGRGFVSFKLILRFTG